MQRLSAWARWIAAGFFTLIVIPLLVEFLKHLAENIGLYDRPREAAGAVLNFFLSLAELPWLRVTALVLGGFVAGLWLDWLLRRLDGSHAQKGEALGYEMVNLGHELEIHADLMPLHQARPKIMSCLTTARKLGIWVPDQRVFDIRADNLIMEYPTRSLITEYLMDVGTMLKDGHFAEAKQAALYMKKWWVWQTT